MTDLVALTDEQREIQRLCRDFAAREIRPISLAVDEADVEVPWEVWRKAAGLGLTSFMLPAEYGGAGMTDCLTSCLVQEELSHGCAGIGNLLTSNGFFAEPVLAHRLVLTTEARYGGSTARAILAGIVKARATGVGTFLEIAETDFDFRVRCEEASARVTALRKSYPPKPRSKTELTSAFPSREAIAFARALADRGLR